MTTKRKTIIRSPRDNGNPYFMVRRATAQDPNLTFQARGMLMYLLSKPDDWSISPADLQKAGDCGRQRVYKILGELLKYGYLVREDQAHVKEEGSAKGRFLPGSYILHEQPHIEKPCDEKPHAAKPYTANQHTTEYRDNKVENLQQQPPAESDRPTPPPKPVVVVGSEDSQDWLDKHVEKAAPLRSRRTDADYGRVCVAYENNIGAITQHIGETLSHACDEYPPEWIVEAINESAERNVRNWKYIDAILKNWNVTGRGAPKPGAKPSGSPLPPADPDCPMCEGKGVYSYDVPYGDPRFGKTEVCACRKPGTQEAAA